MSIEKKDINNTTSSLLTTTQVAKLLHVHSNTARRWADEGIITAYRICRRGDRRFRRDEILQFLNSMSQNNGFLK